MLKRLKDGLLKSLAARSGRLVTAGGALAGGAIAGSLSGWIGNTPTTTGLIIGLTTATLGWLVDGIMLSINAKAVGQIQEEVNKMPHINLDKDRWAGTETLDAVKSVVAMAKAT